MDMLTYAKLHEGTGTINCPVLARVATTAGCSHRTLYMIATGHKRASALMARRIESATSGAVPAATLRPDVFGPIAPQSAAA